MIEPFCKAPVTQGELGNLIKGHFSVKIRGNQEKLRMFVIFSVLREFIVITSTHFPVLMLKKHRNLQVKAKLWLKFSFRKKDSISDEKLRGKVLKFQCS